MGFSIQNHDQSDLLNITYTLGAILESLVPSTKPLFVSAESHEVPLGDLVPILDTLTDAVREWIRAGWLDDGTPLSVRTGRQRVQVEKYLLVKVARDLRDAVEEQVSRGRSMWVS